MKVQAVCCLHGQGCTRLYEVEIGEPVFPNHPELEEIREVITPTECSFCRHTSTLEVNGETITSERRCFWTFAVVEKNKRPRLLCGDPHKIFQIESTQSTT